MKKILYTLLIIVATTIVGTACDGFESSHNGKLDGMWHLVEVDTIYYGASPKVVDFTHNSIFWSFQGKLLCAENKINHFPVCFLRFKHESGMLTVSEPYLFHDRIEPDEKLEDTYHLRPLGINELTEEFVVEKLNRKEMILVGATLRLVFKKY